MHALSWAGVVIGVFATVAVGVAGVWIIIRFRELDETIRALAAGVHTRDETLNRIEKAVQRQHKIQPTPASPSGVELPLAVASWQFWEKTMRNRGDKIDISGRIVAHHLRGARSILLDSGSTVDWVTRCLLDGKFRGVSVYSNNVFAAMNLAGRAEVEFHMFGGVFSDRFAAVYSEKAEQLILDLPIDVYVLATTAIRRREGVMVHQTDDRNGSFKKVVLKAFAACPNSSLIIAADITKFEERVDEHTSVLPTDEWKRFLKVNASRITLVTSQTLGAIVDNPRVKSQLAEFKAAGIALDPDPNRLC